MENEKGQPVRMISKEWHNDYIDLLADPSDKRSNIQFCTDAPIDEKTLYRWLKKFRAEAYEEANRRLRARRGELRIKGWKRLEDMMDDKSGGNVLKALELFFKLNGDLIERVESRTEMLTPEQKKERIAKILSEAANKVEKDNDEKARTDSEREQLPDHQAVGYDPIRPEYGPGSTVLGGGTPGSDPELRPKR